VARNANKYLGLRGDFIFADLPLRQSSLSLAQAGSGTSYLFAFTVDPVINIPVTKVWGGYVLFGPGFYHRSGTLNSDAAVPGSSCNAFFEWWGACPNVSLPLRGSFVHSSQNQFGYNLGAGVTRKVPSGVEIYAEFRLMHGSANGTTTDVRPITIGVRW
jgi:opacity protein-like surface antigen